MDDTIKVQFNKTASDTKKQLCGAKYKVYDSKGRKVHEFTTGKNAELIEGILKAGETYTFKEVSAPKHYKVAKDKKIRIKDTGKLQKLTVVDERIPEVPDTPQTGIKGKTAGMMISLISLLMALGCFVCVRAKDKSINVGKLKGENKECIGYLEVPETTISYPVMQTRDNPDYYLSHDFNKNYSFYGTPYLSAYCDLKKSDNLIIYGHNINGGKMFGALEQYKEKKFFDKHKKIYFTTNQKREYEVFAVMSVNVREFEYWKFVMARDEKDYGEFVEKVLKHSFCNIREKPKYGEQMLMLSTYDNGKGDDWRIVVVGKEI